MASGRMLQRKISKSHDVAALMENVSAELGLEHGPFSALLFTWCIAHADREGRMHGDPRIVRADVFPLVEQISYKHIGVYLKHMQRIGLIHWYEAGGRYWIAFPKFDDSQPGLRKDKESKSVAPDPANGSPVADAVIDGVTTDKGRSKDGVRTEQGRSKDGVRTEQGRSKDGVTPPELPAQRKGKEEKFKGKEVAPSAPNDSRRVVEAWEAGWIAHFGPNDGKAPPAGEPDYKAAKNLIAAHGLDETLALVTRFLDDTDKFVAERGHMLRDLPSRVARYAKGDGPLFRAGNTAPRAAVEVGGDVTAEWTR